MANPDFSQMQYQLGMKRESFAEWKDRLEAQSGHGFKDLYQRTMEQVDLKPLYTGADLS